MLGANSRHGRFDVHHREGGVIDAQLLRLARRLQVCDVACVRALRGTGTGGWRRLLQRPVVRDLFLRRAQVSGGNRNSSSSGKADRKEICCSA